jgi:hypothetical protein
MVHDSEINRENPVENKHLRLTLGHQSTALERELKPNPKTKNQLSVKFFFLLKKIKTKNKTKQNYFQKKCFIYYFYFNNQINN